MNINCNGIIYHIPREPYENIDMLAARAWYITKKAPMNIEQYMKCYRLSIFWTNVKFLNCEYPPEIMKEI